ncbi:hypothetical protein ACH0CA_00885 [Kytococcus sedentarius]
MSTDDVTADDCLSCDIVAGQVTSVAVVEDGARWRSWTSTPAPRAT